MCFNNDIAEVLDSTKYGIEIDSLSSISNVTIADDVTLISPRNNGLETIMETMENRVTSGDLCKIYQKQLS